MKTGVDVGYPVYDGPNRDSATPDQDAVTLRYLNLGVALATEYALASAFQELYANYTAFKGMHPQAAFDEALRVLDIAIPDDFIYHTNTT